LGNEVQDIAITTRKLCSNPFGYPFDDHGKGQKFLYMYPSNCVLQNISHGPMVLSVHPSSLARPEVPVSGSECSLDYHSSVFIRIRLCIKRRAWMGFAGGCIGSMSIENVFWGCVFSERVFWAHRR
jgi:hypothetical protein